MVLQRELSIFDLLASVGPLVGRAQLRFLYLIEANRRELEKERDATVC